MKYFILVSYDVISLFTNVPLEEAIHILVDKAFKDDWFYNAYNLNLRKEQLVELLQAATTDQLFQLDGILYEQKDGVAMGPRPWPIFSKYFYVFP